MCRVQSPAARLSKGGQQGHFAGSRERSATDGGRTTERAVMPVGRGRDSVAVASQVWSESGIEH